MSLKTRIAENVTQLRHGLRTPLNHIIGYAEMLLEDATEHNNSEQSALLREILLDGQRVCDLIGAGPQPEADLDAEVAVLRQSMSPYIWRMKSNVIDLKGLNETDVERIRTGLVTLVHFVDAGTLPANAVLERPSHVSSGRITVRSGHGRVLVVDDDEANRDVLKRHLERQGYEVDQASSGREAIAKLTAEPFEALLLDLVMPDMDGLEVLDSVRQLPQLADLPVLVISASDDLSAVADSIQKGAEDYLLKPFDPVLLYARLSATLERKRLRDRERLKASELEQVTAALERSNEDLQRFAYAASHDLQAPVRTIITYLQLFERRAGAKLNEDECEMIEFAHGAARRMNELIRDLLLYSHASIDASKLERVECQNLLRELVEDLDALIKEAGATVCWDRPMPTLIADATGLRQLFQNLISNAIKYRREDPPQIRISVIEEAAHWRFCVQDNGQGIPAEHTQRIFEMFQRLHGDELPGSGIGLATCQRIVERLGGKIWVESQPGRGSNFFFTMPLRPEGV